MATTARVDPLKNFRFRVRYSDSIVPFIGVHKVSGMKRTVEVVKHRDGGAPTNSSKLPGRVEFDPIVLERGVTVNALEFEKWANKTWSYANAAGGRETSLKDFRRDLVIDVHDETGQKVLSYHVFNCWVSEYQPFSDLDANANAVLVQHIRLENEGWVRDIALPPAAEVSFDDPAV
ncbi:phage tail protein [Streptomyces sp. AB3(2024)]|uniref:phage tail protein n=1 Tax=Streptomyces sp. AB3(2024) TaxID=3317321 RepID=UPI0035A2D5BC